MLGATTNSVNRFNDREQKRLGPPQSEMNTENILRGYKEEIESQNRSKQKLLPNYKFLGADGKESKDEITGPQLENYDQVLWGKDKIKKVL